MINTSYAGKFQVEIFVSFAQSLQILVSRIWLHFIGYFSIQNQQSTFLESSQICRFPKKYTLDQPQSVITGVHRRHLSQHLIDRRAATCVKSPGNNISCMIYMIHSMAKVIDFGQLQEAPALPETKHCHRQNVKSHHSFSLL